MNYRYKRGVRYKNYMHRFAEGMSSYGAIRQNGDVCAENNDNDFF